MDVLDPPQSGYVYRFGVGREWHVVYSDTSSRRGRWCTDNTEDLFGKFYAATRRIAGCKGGESEITPSAVT